MYGVSILFVCVVGALLFQFTAAWALTWALRIPVHDAVFGLGPRLTWRIWRYADVEWRVLPLSWQMRFLQREAAEGWVPLPPELDTWRFFHELPWPMRATLVVAPQVVVFGLAGLVLGLSEAWTQMGDGIGQLWHGLWSPIDVGAPLCAAWIELAEARPLTAAAVLVAKCSALELLPLPNLALGRLLLQVKHGTVGLSEDPIWREIARDAGVFVVRILWFVWTFALFSTVW